MRQIYFLLIALMTLSYSLSYAQGYKPPKRKVVRFKENKIKKRVKSYDHQSGFNLDLAHSTGTKGFDVNFLIGEETKMFTTDYQYFFKKNIGLKVGLGYEYGAPYSIPYEGYYFQVQPIYNLVKFREKLFLNLMGGFSMVHDDYPGLEELNNKLNYGATLGAEAEFMVSERLLLLTSFEQKYILGYGRWFWGLGLRYIMF
ncbi:hypothetical protein [Flexithrix dorotheae]|uniref:hypothetical protein n=1 Tax=Flexithrix dorotheae TaxID=70993 RepID=UPI00039E686C|nr:hypothetical protein [Flexithrix dorotheae]